MIDAGDRFVVLFPALVLSVLMLLMFIYYNWRIDNLEKRKGCDKQ